MRQSFTNIPWLVFEGGTRVGARPRYDRHLRLPGGSVKFVVFCAVVMLVSGCSAGAQTPPPSSAAPDPLTLVRPLTLSEEVTAAKGLVSSGAPVEGVTKLVECPELASAGQALAGVTVTWTRSTPTQQVTVTQYSVVYQGIPGKDVIKQARAASTCHRDVRIGYELGYQPTDEYLHSGEDLGPTKPFVDDRYGYCLSHAVSDRSVCIALLAKGDKVIRLRLDMTGKAGDLDNLWLTDFSQDLTDRLVA
jgi:hypothetical protein